MSEGVVVVDLSSEKDQEQVRPISGRVGCSLKNWAVGAGRFYAKTGARPRIVDRMMHVDSCLINHQLVLTSIGIKSGEAIGNVTSKER